MLPQELFTRFLCLERRRTERSGRRFILMLLDPGNLPMTAKGPLMSKVLAAVWGATRDTDLKGWYRQETILGVIFTEIGEGDSKSIVHHLSHKVIESLHHALTVEQTNEIKITFHIFPEDWSRDGTSHPVTSSLQTALALEINRKPLSLRAKRVIDILGSLIGLLLCLPVMLLIGLAIKLTSKGPVLFRQTRLGQYGKTFTFLKFRSMYVDSDNKIHQDYVAKFIVGAAEAKCSNGQNHTLYKLTADPRITPVGRFLRNTSLDELPQLLNVLCGEMSLVGPRPPVIYEFERYHLWHRQRLLAVRPGITGLWQVDGRSRVKFDDMVRLDIRYARTWSLWLDCKILLQTPRAVLTGAGAC
jgi:exopolysaccharide biosynthesis polyprenyl glycosylphosphotransferase